MAPGLISTIIDQVQPSKLSDFYIRSGLFGILSLSGALFNYALYPVLTRILSTRDFGDFAAILAISNQIMGMLVAFNVISIYLVKTQEEKARAHAQVIQKTLIWIFLLATIVVAAASPYLHNLLKIKSVSSFIVLAMILATAVPAVIWTGYLQGHKEMIRVGVYNLGSSLGKFILIIALAGFLGTIGAIWGLLGGALLGLLILRVMPGVTLPKLSSIFEKSSSYDKKYLSGLRGYFLECLFVVGVLSFLQNYDITLAKALFKPDIAGTYSGISVLSNALYYLSFLLVWIILPEIKINNQSNNRRILGTAYKLLGLLALVTIFTEFLFKNTITKLLLGSQFSNQGDVLIFASLYQLTLVSITLYAFYLLVCRKRRAILLGGVVFGLSTIIPVIIANTPLEMIRYLWLALLVGVGVYGATVKFFSERRGISS